MQESGSAIHHPLLPTPNTKASSLEGPCERGTLKHKNQTCKWVHIYIPNYHDPRNARVCMSAHPRATFAYAIFEEVSVRQRRAILLTILDWGLLADHFPSPLPMCGFNCFAHPQVAIPISCSEVKSPGTRAQSQAGRRSNLWTIRPVRWDTALALALLGCVAKCWKRL